MPPLAINSAVGDVKFPDSPVDLFIQSTRHTGKESKQNKKLLVTISYNKSQ